MKMADAIELSRIDSQSSGKQYMEFYSDMPTTTGNKQVSVPHEQTPGGDQYAKVLPKDARPGGKAPKKGRRSRVRTYETISSKMSKQSSGLAPTTRKILANKLQKRRSNLLMSQ